MIKGTFVESVTTETICINKMSWEDNTTLHYLRKKI